MLKDASRLVKQVVEEPSASTLSSDVLPKLKELDDSSDFASWQGGLGAFFEELSAALAAIPSNHFSNLTINEAIVGEKGRIEG